MTLGGPERIVLGTRGSALARAQASLVAEALKAKFPGCLVEVKVIETRGDREQGAPISVLGDKGVFVRAIERALMAGEVDLAVHSLKDVPSDVEPEELELVAFLPREDPRDVLISRSGISLEALDPGATVGTGSLRRRVQLLAIRPDVRVEGIRGNVDTRLRKLESGEYDAIMLAAAGLRRLGIHDRITEYFDTDQFVPDAGQGIVAVQARSDSGAARLASVIDDRAAHASALAERAVVRALGANCHSPVGAYAVVTGEHMDLTAMAALPSGSPLFRDRIHGEVDRAEELGASLGQTLKLAAGTVLY